MSGDCEKSISRIDWLIALSYIRLCDPRVLSTLRMLGKSKLPLLKVTAPNAICDTISPPDPERALRSHVLLSTSVKGGEQLAAFTARGRQTALRRYSPNRVCRSWSAPIAFPHGRVGSIVVATVGHRTQFVGEIASGRMVNEFSQFADVLAPEASIQWSIQLVFVMGQGVRKFIGGKVDCQQGLSFSRTSEALGV